MAAATARPCCILDCRLRSGQNRVDGGIVDARKVFDVVRVIPLPFRIDCDRTPDGTDRLRLFRVGRRDLRGFPQRADAVGRERPIGGLAGDPPTRAQDVAGDCQLMGRCANILRGVVEDEVFEMDEFAVNPQRGAGIGEMGAFEEALADP